MVKVEKDNGFYLDCQACHACRTDEVIYSISISDGRYGVELHLCKDCCKKLSKEIKRNIKVNITND